MYSSDYIDKIYSDAQSSSDPHELESICFFNAYSPDVSKGLFSLIIENYNTPKKLRNAALDLLFLSKGNSNLVVF